MFPPAAQASDCSKLLPANDGPRPRDRGVLPEDLIGLRDIGPVDRSFPDATLFSISPDQKRIAFQIHRADSTSNSYCRAMVVIDIAKSPRPTIVDAGGELIRLDLGFRGKAAFPSGIPAGIDPQWSSDGHWIVFLKKVGDTTQLWRAATDGQGSERITESPADVDDFRFSPDGAGVVFTSLADLRPADEAIEAEGRSGFHFDDRYSPMSRSRPFANGPLEPAYRYRNLQSGLERPATAAEIDLFRVAPAELGDALAFAQGRQGRRAWLDPAAANESASTRHLRVSSEAGSFLSCPAEACSGRISRPWWSLDGRHLRYFRREGWALATTAIYDWVPGTGTPRRIFATDDLLIDCAPLGDRLVCLRETSLRPRHFMIFSSDMRHVEELFDPNPDYVALQKGTVERLRQVNAQGIESFGDLVLPVGYVRGRRYPLIIVQYESRGFLRGGTGDEYPVQAFANRGYAVFSANRPRDVGYVRGARGEDVDRINLQGFVDRESVQSSLEIAIRQLTDRGIVDARRIGITGLSDGASTVQYGVLNSSLFAAAAMSSCCWDPMMSLFVGPRAAREFERQGYPKLSSPADQFWSRISFARNASKLIVPTLLQLSDDEYLSSLEGYTAMRNAGAPVDMFIFPREHHVKWQPAHRLAIYRRSIDWFDYWLRGIRSFPEDRAKDLETWRMLEVQRNGPDAAR